MVEAGELRPDQGRGPGTVARRRSELERRRPRCLRQADLTEVLVELAHPLQRELARSGGRGRRTAPSRASEPLVADARRAASRTVGGDLRAGAAVAGAELLEPVEARGPATASEKIIELNAIATSVARNASSSVGRRWRPRR